MNKNKNEFRLDLAEFIRFYKIKIYSLNYNKHLLYINNFNKLLFSTSTRIIYFYFVLLFKRRFKYKWQFLISILLFLKFKDLTVFKNNLVWFIKTIRHNKQKKFLFHTVEVLQKIIKFTIKKNKPYIQIKWKGKLGVTGSNKKKKFIFNVSKKKAYHVNHYYLKTFKAGSHKHGSINTYFKYSY